MKQKTGNLESLTKIGKFVNLASLSYSPYEHEEIFRFEYLNNGF